MGQAKQKNQYINQCFSLMRQLGDATESQVNRTKALDELLLVFGQKLFNLDAGSTANEQLYRKAMVHDDMRVRQGLESFMDIFLGYAWRGTHNAPQSLTVALFCGLDLPALDMIGSMDETRPVREWLSTVLSVPRDKIDVYPATVDPTLCYQDINSLILDFYGAKETHQPGQARKDSVRYDEKKPDAQDYVVVLATLRLDTDTDLERIVESLEQGVEIDQDDHFDITYQVDGSVNSATVTPLHLEMPFTALKKYAFYYAQQKLKVLIEQLGNDGLAPETLGVDISVGTLSGAPEHGTAVYAEVYKRDNGERLGQRYMCQIDYAAFGMGAALDAVLDAGVGEVRLNGVVVDNQEAASTA